MLIVERELVVQAVAVGWVEEDAFDLFPSAVLGLVGEVGMELIEIARFELSPLVVARESILIIFAVENHFALRPSNSDICQHAREEGAGLVIEAAGIPGDPHCRHGRLREMFCGKIAHKFLKDFSHRLFVPGEISEPAVASG